MVKARAGKSSLGCLLSLLILSALIYFGINIGEVYWRAYQFEDAMKQEVRFASQIPDQRMLLHLQAFADTLGLPEEARDINIVRAGRRISVEAAYSERVEFPLYVREIHFNPKVQGSY